MDAAVIIQRLFSGIPARIPEFAGLLVPNVEIAVAVAQQQGAGFADFCNILGSHATVAAVAAAVLVDGTQNFSVPEIIDHGALQFRLMDDIFFSVLTELTDT